MRTTSNKAGGRGARACKTIARGRVHYNHQQLLHARQPPRI